MIVIVLPAFNEAEALPRLLARIQAAARDLPEPCRVVVVDDGSVDGTGACAGAGDTPDVPVTVVAHAVNAGLHAALDTGLREALAGCGPDDWVVTMDADDTHPPALIAEMRRVAAAERADLVIASRFRRGAVWHGRTVDRILFSYGVSYLYRVLWPMRGVRDYTCGYRLYRASLLQRARQRWGDQLVSEPSFACMPDLLWKLYALRPQIREVPLELHYDRKPGPTKMQVARTIRRTLVLLVQRRFAR
jgi:dolichol-phosphate mannosyltransferase